VVVTVRLPLDWVPDGGLSPVHPPEAVHEAVSVLTQLSDTLPPGRVVLGFAINATVGGSADPATATVTVCEALPPDPAQLST
jgi:hypothetical protein